MVIYLIDANVLIDASRDYYPITRVPEFWEWLAYVAAAGHVKIPVEVYEEIQEGEDDLGKWARSDGIKEALLLDEEVDVFLVSRITDEGYASDLTDDEVEKVGRDPFLIAYALAAPGERCIVTTEVSKPTKQRANRHVPDVCNQFDVRCCDPFTFLRMLDFRTGWKSR
ncbi:DUF4411 family protein [Candidatus Poribacteria bacterium]|nr:DUF4411 family protein [Candidatus Poribacteria bacterium]